MARTSHITRTSRRLAAALAVAGAVAATAGPAAAIPAGGGTGIPPNQPPVAKIAGTPNPSCRRDVHRQEAGAVCRATDPGRGRRSPSGTAPPRGTRPRRGAPELRTSLACPR